MTIDEAMKRLSSFRDWFLTEFVDEDIEAIKLGIEALRRQEYLRLHFGQGFQKLLPGETKEVK